MRYLIALLLFTACEPTEVEKIAIAQSEESTITQSITPQPLPLSYDIYLCIGQSNMVGRATIEPQDNGSGAFLFNGVGWEIADGRLNRYSTIAAAGLLSLTNSFGKQMNLYPHPRLKRIGLVVNAKGGTSIQDWRNGLIQAGIARTHQALAANPNNRLRAIIWHQGEANAPDTTGYMSNLTWMVDTLRQEFGNVPFVLGQVFQKPAYANINTVLLDAPNHITNCAVVSSAGLTTFDQVHFDSPSAREFGNRYAAAVVNIQ